VLENSAGQNDPGSLLAIFEAVDNTSSFWKAYDILTMIVYASFGTNDAVHELAYPQIISLFQSMNVHQPQQTYLLELMYSELSFIKISASSTVCLACPIP
jgi:hypothetical protein